MTSLDIAYAPLHKTSTKAPYTYLNETYPHLKPVNLHYGDFDMGTEDYPYHYYYDTTTGYVWEHRYSFVTNSYENKLVNIGGDYSVDLKKQYDYDVKMDGQPAELYLSSLS